MPRATTWSEFHFIKTLGEEKAGFVSLARLTRSYKNLPTGSYLAVKRYKNQVLEQSGEMERIFREFEIERRVRHPNLVRILSVIRYPVVNSALEMVYYQGETLESYLQRMRRKKN